MQRKRRMVTLAAAAVCALGGAAAGISESSAAKTKQSTTHAHAAQSAAPGAMGAGGGSPGGGRGPGGPGGGAVHSVDVVLNKAGTAFISETTDSGTITDVDSTAGTITIKEGTKSVVYGTPTITIPADATVMLDGKSSSLGGLSAGDEVRIGTSSDGTNVFAMDSSFKPGEGGMGGPPPGGKPAGAQAGSSSSSE